MNKLILLFLLIICGCGHPDKNYSTNGKHVFILMDIGQKITVTCSDYDLSHCGMILYDCKEEYNNQKFNIYCRQNAVLLRD
jgi:hypothetical protein